MEEDVFMKKVISVIIAVISVFLLMGCGSKKASDVAIDYGHSEIFSAIQLIKEEFSKWDGCELHKIAYSADEECNADNISWMNNLEAANDAKETFTQCIMFTSEFHSPKKGGGAWNPDQEYTDWQWWLARSDGGQWNLITWGY